MSSEKNDRADTPSHGGSRPRSTHNLVRRIATEPLVHFLLIGLALFFWYGAVGDPVEKTDTRPQIVLTENDLNRLAQQFEGAWRRSPTDTEMAALVEDYLKEEVLYREALSLGMDRDDAVIRRRLRQKMEFLTTAAAETLEPDPGVLEAWLADHNDLYASPPRLTFDQVYLGETPTDDALSLMDALNSGADPATLGQATLLPASMTDARPAAIDGTFGDGFADTLLNAPSGIWTGPVQSAYGMHLLHVTDITMPPPPTLATIGDQVRADWQRAEVDRLNEVYFQSLLDRYTLVMPGDAIQ